MSWSESRTRSTISASTRHSREGDADETGTAARLLGSTAAGGRRRARRRRRGRRLRRDLHRRGVGLRRVHAAGLVGPRDQPGAARHLDRADVRPDADLDRDARADPRPPRPAAGSSSAWASAARRSSRAGTASRSPSRSPAPARSSTSSARCWRARRRSPTTARTTRCRTTVPGAVGLGKPLKPIVHPLRADIPIWLGAEGPKNVAQTAEIADGWIPIFYTPKSAGMYQPWLDEGFARPGARRTREDFEIAATCHLQITDQRGGAARRHRRAQALDRALHGRHGRQGAELPQERLRPDGLRRDHRRGAGALPRRQARRGHRADPRRARRGHAHRRRRGLREGARRGSGRRPA